MKPDKDSWNYVAWVREALDMLGRTTEHLEQG